MAAAQLRPGELVVDLGAGTGSLSVPLARTGARVIAVELHPGRAEELTSDLSGALEAEILEQEQLFVDDELDAETQAAEGQ